MGTEAKGGLPGVGKWHGLQPRVTGSPEERLGVLIGERELASKEQNPIMGDGGLCGRPPVSPVVLWACLVS